MDFLFKLIRVAVARAFGLGEQYYCATRLRGHSPVMLSDFFVKRKDNIVGLRGECVCSVG
jgi:hypothetical protein